MHNANRVLRSVWHRLFFILIAGFSQTSAASVETRPPMAGWGQSVYIYTDTTAAYAPLCAASGDPGLPPGHIEMDDGGASFKFWCINTLPDGTTIEITGNSWRIYWKTVCQTGYAENDVSVVNGKRTIGSCTKSAGLTPNKPESENCCKAGNPIVINSRRKIQKEVDYTGTGAYPLVFERTYSSSPPGLTSASEGNSATYRAWQHNYQKALTGNLENDITQSSRYENKGEYWTPEATASAGVDTSIIAYRPYGGYLYFNTFTPATDIQETLERATTPTGETGYLLRTTSGEEEYYAKTGRLVATRSRSGETHYLQYNNNTGLLESVSDDFGKSLTFQYAGRLLVSVTDPAGGIIRFTYNEFEDFTAVSYPDTGDGIKQKRYHYEAQNNPRFLTGITDEKGVRFARWEYDTDGFAATSEHINGIDRVTVEKTTPTEPDVTVTNALGLETIYRYQVINGRRLLVGKERIAKNTITGASEQFTYNEHGFLTQRLDWNGNVTIYERNDRNLATQEVSAVGTDQEKTIDRIWHPEHRLPTQEIFDDYTIDSTYNGQGNLLVRTITDNTSGEVRTWSYTYNAFGKMRSVDGPRTDVADITQYTYYDCNTGNACGQLQTISNGLGHVTTLNSYDAHGNPLQVTDANGVLTELTYDARQRLTARTVDGQTSSFAYDGAGNLLKVTLPDATFTRYGWDGADRLTSVADAQGNRIDWVLDDKGNRIEEKTHDNAGAIKKSLNRAFDALSRIVQSVSAHGGNTHFSYDANNNLEQQTDADNRVTLQGFDAFDRLIALTDALQGQTQFAYNKQDLPTQVTDAKGLTTHYSYNGFGDTTVATSPDTGTTTYTYDAAGNRTTQTDARGVTVNFSFDALDRIKTVSYPESRENISYSYDQGSFAVGKLTKITDQSGSTDYSYDARGNKVAVTHTIEGQRYTTTYRYNSADRLTGMTYPDGWEIDYSYDTSGRISQVQSARDGNTETLATTIQRLPFGPVTAMTLGNAINRTRSYDLDYRVQNINDGSVLSRNYGYSAVDNITAITNSITPALSQLFSYDNLDRLNFATGDYGDKSYSYDSVGNRLSLTTDSGANSQTQSYHYNTDSHRLDSITGERGFQYDAAGNTTDNALASFTYNDRNRMASSTVNAATTTYQHNALGQRVRKTGSSGETHFIFDLDGKLIAEAEGSGVISVDTPILMANHWRCGALMRRPRYPVLSHRLPPWDR